MPATFHHLTTAHLALPALLLLGAIIPPSNALAATQTRPATIYGELPTLSLPERVTGERAISSLANNIEALAKAHGLTTEQLKSALRRDSALVVEKTGNLTVKETGMVIKGSSKLTSGATAKAAGTASAAPYALDQTFKLHSLPGSQRVIYLDFDGHKTSGTQWNSNYTKGAAITSAAFDIDGDAKTFSAAERELIQLMWQRVVEDFAPFGVDVTTEDPGTAAIIKSGSSDTIYGVRVVVSPTSAWLGDSAGGVAMLNSFGYSSDTPCFVFSDQLGPNDEKYVAEAISHEIGHTYGLSHQGVTGGTDYYSGHGDWAPIMGIGYHKSVTQWSKGEFASANNTEDATAIIARSSPYLADDHADTRISATRFESSNPNTGGVIDKPTDKDIFRFDINVGRIDLALQGTAPENNLDIQAELLDATGAVLTTSNPSGLTAQLTDNLSAGTYFLRVRGVGVGSAKTDGYSNYGSLGEYVVSGTTPTVLTGQAPSASVTASPASGAAPLAVEFSAVASSSSESTVARRVWDFGDGTTGEGDTIAHTYEKAGQYTATLTVIDTRGLAGLSTVKISVSSASVQDENEDEDNSDNTAPVAVIRTSTTSGNAPLTVRFLGALSNDSDGTTVAYG
jgi:PKD repeat protein